MFLQGLKINLSIHLVVLISLGMIMVNFAMTTAFQKIFINREIRNSDLLISTIQSRFDRQYTQDETFPLTEFISDVNNTLNKTGYVCAVVMDENRQRVYQDASIKAMIGFFEVPIRQSMSDGEKKIGFLGETWGVFWKAEKYLLISFPLVYDDISIVGVGIAYNLSDFYLALRQMQQLLLMFMGVAVVLLSFIGFYQLSKIAVNPIYRLLRRVEEFETEDQLFSQYTDKSNEFKRLSYSLNQMLMRITQDKRMLQSTIQSLEKSNNELKQAQKEIIKSEKLASVGRLSAGIAHEIGNPIGIILGYIDLLKKNNIKEDDKEEYLFRAEKEILRVKNIIRQLLDYTRPANEGIQTISVHTLLNDLIRMITPQPLTENISVSVNFNAERDHVLGNPDLLLQVFLNLFVNAADAVGSNPNNLNGEIVIATENNSDPNSRYMEDVIQIKFIDNGTGISEKDRETLFDPFFTTKQPGKGTGLGLYVSFMIIENMGGKIEVVSESPNNTIMIVKLKTVLREIKEAS